MTRSRMATLGASLIFTTSIVASTNGVAQAHHANYYGDSARSVAKHIGCKKFSGNGGGELNKDSGVCWLKGKRVNVITFKGAVQQGEWNGAAKVALPSDHWWANGKGALVTARNGNKSAAQVGAKALPGKLVKAY
ncbi:hypothetical protein BKA08_003009 [Nocardioides marinisabuli]|uniref:Uncharacterized protein n=1 Tax=Nocardioides marinisabuli TaxID=419476 RepID=A0A7Y9F3M2_9ACTN|nr:hypothetical protein [Nocardioides marinisabuli]NYD58771.1 hypothetical protein [Nocardioides marinisabuli]